MEKIAGIYRLFLMFVAVLFLSCYNYPETQENVDEKTIRNHNIITGD